MRQLAFSLTGFLAISAMMVSCARMEDSDAIADGDLSVNYAVQVVPVGDVDKGLDGATVTIQVQGQTKQATVGPDGIAVFPDCRPGTISGYVTAAGYAPINFTAAISKTNIDANTNDFVTSTVYMIARNSTLEGRIYGDFDLDGTAPLNDNASFTAVDLYVTVGIAGGYPMGTGNGMLTSVNLDTQVYGITTAGNGTFSLADLPTTANGYLTAQYWMADWSVIDNVTDATVVFNIPATGVQLNPGVTTNIGDVLAN